MIAELAAANAAFAVIKAALANGKELVDVGSKAIEYFNAKSSLQEAATEKAGGRPIEGRNDLEEFLALEKLRQQEDHLRETMVYAGRPGMWTDWLAFQAKAARAKREAKEAAARERARIRARNQVIAQVVLVSVAAAGVLAATLYGVFLIAGRP